MTHWHDWHVCSEDLIWAPSIGRANGVGKRRVPTHQTCPRLSRGTETQSGGREGLVFNGCQAMCMICGDISSRVCSSSTGRRQKETHRRHHCCRRHHLAWYCRWSCTLHVDGKQSETGSCWRRRNTCAGNAAAWCRRLVHSSAVPNVVRARLPRH